MQEKDGKAIYLHLELRDPELKPKCQDILRKYGKSPNGISISRDILVPRDMTLDALHYTIQRLFGWLNMHNRTFNLPREDFEDVTEGKVKTWSRYVGKLFQTPSQLEAARKSQLKQIPEERVTQENFQKKYTGPYDLGNQKKAYELSQADIQSMLDAFPEVEIHNPQNLRSFDFEHGTKKPLQDLTMDQLRGTMFMASDFTDLMEHLLVDEILAYEDEPLRKPEETQNLSHRLFYAYDESEAWVVEISKKHDAEELIRQGLVKREAVERAKEQVEETYAPVCLVRQGLNVFEDIGGLTGFCTFLDVYYGSSYGADAEEKEELANWAKDLGWIDEEKNPIDPANVF